MSRSLLSRLRRARALAVLVPLAVLLASCDDDPTDPEEDDDGPKPVADIVLSEDTVRLVPESATTLTASTYDADGGLVTDRTVTWSSSNPGVATVDGGLVTAVTTGAATVTASAEGVSAGALIVVRDVVLSENTIEADSVLELTSDSAEVAQGTLRYTLKAGQDRDVSVGDILVGSTNEGGGYLKRATGVQSAGGVITVQAVDATFAEAVESANLEITVDETIQQVLRNDYASGDTEGLRLADGVSLAPDGTLQMSRLQLDFEFDESHSPKPGVVVSATLDGSFAVLTGSDAVPGAETFKFNLQTTAGVPDLFRVRTTAAVEMSASIEASVTGDLADAYGLDREKEIFRRKLLPKGQGCIMKGIVCYSVHVVVDVYADVTAAATLDVSQSSYLRAGVFEAGVEYLDGTWTQIGHSFMDHDFAPPEILAHGEAGVRLGLRPSVELVVYEGLASAAAGVDGGVKAELTADPWQWHSEVGFAIDLFAKAELSFWGALDEKVDYFYPVFELTLFETDGALVSVDATPHLVPLSVGDSEQLTATAYSLLTGGAYPFAPPMDWEVEDPTVATIDADGRVTGVAVGRTRYRGEIRGTGIYTEVWDIVVGDQLALQVTPTGRSTVYYDGPAVTFEGLVTAGDEGVAGATVSVHNGMTNQTFQETTDAQGRFTFTPAFNVHLANGVYAITFGPVTKEGYDALTTPLVREVEKVDPPSVLGVGACLSLDGATCVGDETLAPGQAFFVRFGADDKATAIAKCDVEVDLFDPFTNATVTYVTQPPTCIGSHAAEVPGGAGAGTYTFLVGPARLAGYQDGPQIALEVVVEGGGGGGGGTPPTVVSMTPAPGGDVPVESLIQVTFSEPMDLSSFAAGFLVEAFPAGGGSQDVPGSVALDASGTVATFTPDEDLREFGTIHSVTVTSDIRDAEGDHGQAQFVSQFATELLSTAYYYQLLNGATGQALDTPELDGVKTCFMADPGAYSGQHWYFDDAGVQEGVQHHYVRNAFGGDDLYLEGSVEPSRCLLTPGDFTGQYWRFEFVQNGSAVARLKTLSHGDARTLGLLDGAPMMLSGAAGDDRLWTFSRRGPRQ